MPYRRTRSWREWFFEVFAPNGYMRLEPLPKSQAERELEDEARRAVPPKDITLLGLDSEQPKSSP